MGIENIMYFALGLLAAGLVALAIMPAVWRRAVRLTKKRIEAATPITMAEFRADKDQLRAEFALSTRRLEMNVEALRRRLSAQLGDINRKRSEVGSIKDERDNQLTQIRELEEREAELRRRILDLEKEGADLAQRLRMRDREYADKTAQLENAREALRGKTPRSIDIDGKALSRRLQHRHGHAARQARGRSQARRLPRNPEPLVDRPARNRRQAFRRRRHRRRRTARLTGQKGRRRDRRAGRADRRRSPHRQHRGAHRRGPRRRRPLDRARPKTSANRLLAEKLAIEDEVEQLRSKVLSVEATIMADWDSDRIEQSHLREKLNDIASEVSRLVYAAAGEVPDSEESLFERVQKYSDESLLADENPDRSWSPEPVGSGSAVSDRLAALRDIQRRT